MREDLTEFENGDRLYIVTELVLSSPDCYLFKSLKFQKN